MRALPQWLRALGNTADGVFVADAAQRIVLWNKAAEKLLGYPASEVLGRRCYEVMGGRTREGKAWCEANCPVQREVQQGSQVQNFDVRTRTKASQPVWVNITILTVPRKRGPWTLHIARDVTRIERHEEVLRLIQQTLRLQGLLGNENNAKLSTQNSLAVPAVSPANQCASLTRREREVLQLLLRGLSTGAIANQLHVSRNTVRNHVCSLLRKCGVHSRAQLAVSALKNGCC